MNLTVQEASTRQDFCCSVNEGRIILKRDHEYNAQVQGQMAVCHLKWCDFVVYTNKGMSVERIYFDGDFWTNMLYPKLTDLYFNHAISYLS